MILIDTDELDKIKYHLLPYTHIVPSDVDAGSYKRGWNDAIDAAICYEHTIEERKTGRWIEGRDERFVKCSECGMESTKNALMGIALFREKEPHFCPNCGADMRGEKDEK